MYVFLSFDFDADSAEELYYSDRPVKRSLARFSIRRGLSRVLSLLDKFDIKTTFFVPGWVVERYPVYVERIVSVGHEVGLHGYMHEKLYELEYDEEVEVHKRSWELVSSVQGKVYGFRKPYFEMSRNTLNILAELGILYDSSLMDSDEPYVMVIGDKEIVELPIYDMYDDWLLFEVEHWTPQEVLRFWKYEFESAWELGLKYFSLILHPSCIGRASRIRMLEDFILYLRRRKIRFLRGVDIAKETLKSLKGED